MPLLVPRVEFPFLSFFIGCLHSVKFTFIFFDMCGSVCKWEVIFCGYYGMGIFCGMVLQDGIPFLLSKITYVNSVVIEVFCML